MVYSSTQLMRLPETREVQLEIIAYIENLFKLFSMLRNHL